MNAPVADRVVVLALALGAVATLVVARVQGTTSAATVAAGAAVGLANFVALRRALSRLVQATADDGAPAAGAALGLVAKFGVLAVVLYLLIVVGGLGAPAFAIGVSAVPLSIVATALYSGRHAVDAPTQQGL